MDLCMESDAILISSQKDLVLKALDFFIDSVFSL